MEKTPNELIKAKQREVNEDGKKLKAEQDRVTGDKADLSTLTQNAAAINTTLTAYKKAYSGYVTRWSHLQDTFLPVCHARVKHYPNHPPYKEQVAKAFEKVETEVARYIKEIGEEKPSTINSTGMIGHAEELSAKKTKADAVLAKIQERFTKLTNTTTDMDKTLKALETIVATINSIAAPGPKLNKLEHEDPAQMKSLIVWTEELERQLKKKENQPIDPKELEVKLHEVFAELDEEISRPRKATEEASNAQTDLEAKQTQLADLQNDTDRQNYILKLLHAGTTPPPAPAS
jgi:hypothetical protein